MRKSLLVLCLFVLAAIAPSAFAECCSCTAPNHNCSASACCTGGCVAICGNNGNCSADCSGQQGDLNPKNQHLRTAPGDLSTSSDALTERVNLDVVNAGADEISALVTNLAGREFTFVPGVPDERFSVQATNFPVGQLISALAKHGAVGAFPRRLQFGELQTDERVNLEAKEVAGARLAQMVDVLTGGRVGFIPSDPVGLVNLEVKNMRLGELLSHLRMLGEVTLDGQPVAP